MGDFHNEMFIQEYQFITVSCWILRGFCNRNEENVHIVWIYVFSSELFVCLVVVGPFLGGGGGEG